MKERDNDHCPEETNAAETSLIYRMCLIGNRKGFIISF